MSHELNLSGRKHKWISLEAEMAGTGTNTLFPMPAERFLASEFGNFMCSRWQRTIVSNGFLQMLAEYPQIGGDKVG
jgi:hypothetical protein